MSDTENRASHPLPHPARVTISDRVIVRVTGPGTDKFLQGQFSQQIDDVTQSHSPRAAACTPKGRAYCLTRLVREGDDVLMELPVELADDTISHLRKYLMLFRGTSMEKEANAGIIGLMGESSIRQLLPDAAGKLAAPGDALPVNGGSLIRTMDTAEGLARYELWHTGDLDSSLQQLLDDLPEIALADWHASEIAAGVAALSPATKEGFVPQMLNWQHVGGIHFKKGCYTGQEVIARMHFLGQLKKSLFRLASEGAPSDPVTPGSSILAGGKECGTVVNSIAYADGTAGILAVIRHASSSETLTLEDSTPVHICPLPYSVPERAGNASTDT